MDTPDSSTEKPPFDPERLHYSTWWGYVSKWRFRFTLGPFILWISLICLLLGNVVTGALLLQSKQRLHLAERQTGFLDYDDPSKIHITRLTSPGPGTWQFRAHLPEGRSYRLCHQVGKVPATDYTESAFPKELESGDFTFSFVLHETKGGPWSLLLQGWRDGPNGYRNRHYHGHVGLGKQTGNDWIYATRTNSDSTVWTTTYSLYGMLSPRFYVLDVSEIPYASDLGHVSFEPDDIVQLLRLRVANVDMTNRPASPSTSELDAMEAAADFPTEADGIMFWIEPVTQGPTNAANATHP